MAAALKESNVLLENIEANSAAITEKIALNIAVQKFDNAVEHLVRLNIIDALNLPITLRENFNCKIIKGNTASVNADKNGIYRYFTRSADNKNKIYCDIITLFQIIYNTNYYTAIDKLCKLANIEVAESNWADAQKIKYADNIAIIKNAEEKMADFYPVLYKYIKKHLYLLEQINRVGITNIATQKEAIRNESVFFVSTKFLEQQLKNTENAKNQSTLNRAINMFCSLGFIEKVSEKDVPRHLIKIAKEKATKEDSHFLVSFYKIPSMDTALLIEAEKRVVKLKKAKVSALQINTNNLAEILGKEVFEAVYRNTIFLTNIIKETKDSRKDEYQERRKSNRNNDYDDFSNLPF